jgi:serine/threonine protein kinase
MLTGKKAFRGDSITGLIFKIITEEPPPLRAEDPDIPEEMVRIISKSLAKQADQRYQTGGSWPTTSLPSAVLAPHPRCGRPRWPPRRGRGRPDRLRLPRYRPRLR